MAEFPKASPQQDNPSPSVSLSAGRASSGLTDGEDHRLLRLPSEEVIAALGSSRLKGLTLALAETRLAEDGPNELGKHLSASAFLIFIHQFQSSVVFLLLAATAISFFMQEYMQMAGIIAAIVINAVVGFLTEYRAKVSLEELSRLTGATARIRRAGQEMNLPVSGLLRGDIVLLEAGSRVPADLRIIEAANFSVDESTLTGESSPVVKTAELLDAEDPGSTAAFQGTIVVGGRAAGIIFATGARTKLGRLGTLLSEIVSGETPLEADLDRLGHQLTILTIAVCVGLAVLGLIQHYPIHKMLETSIALAVAAIPEGLPVVATLALAIGIGRMVRARALVRRLAAVETLGCTSVICTDKTGTLTENRMLVTDLVTCRRHFTLSGRGYEPVGQLACAESDGGSLGEAGALQLLSASALCNDARLENHADSDGWHVHGDPTEGALLSAALKLGLDQDALNRDHPRIAESPFDLNRKRMSTLHECTSGGALVLVKGSPESVFDICNYVLSEGAQVSLDGETRAWFSKENSRLANAGLRVLAVASKEIASQPVCLDSGALEADLCLLGLIAMSDRPKEHVKEAISSCQAAGIRVIMLTGDQKATAASIAAELGMASAPCAATTGAELWALSEDALQRVLKEITVIARVTPEMKLDIVRRLQAAGQIVAMTGDGVNDAPALKQANIGVAMGQAGTDLAREASDLVITDDNFATIVKAVEQGRIIYENIKCAVAYLLTASLTSVLAITIGLFANQGLLLLPLQLLWLNLIMHIFPGLGIALQTSTSNIMSRPPRLRTDKLLDRFEQFQITLRATVVSIAAVAAISIHAAVSGQGKATSVALATLSASLLLQSWSWLYAGRTIVQGKGLRINWPMLINTGLGALTLTAAIYFPPLAGILGTAALGIQDFAIVTCLSLATFLVTTALGRWHPGWLYRLHRQ